MFPRFLMQKQCRKLACSRSTPGPLMDHKGILRDEPLIRLWPQVSVLLVVGVVLFVIARTLARRWEYS